MIGVALVHIAAMPGYHVVVVMMARVAYQLADDVVIYGPSGLGAYFRSMAMIFTSWPAGCLTMVSTAAQDWRHYDLFYSYHPWHAVPYGHFAYSPAGRLGDAIAEWQGAFARL